MGFKNPVRMQTSLAYFFAYGTTVQFRDDNIYIGSTLFCNPYALGLQFNKWQCMALTRNSGYMKFWIDGVSKAGPTRFPSSGPEITITIGGVSGWLPIGCTQGGITVLT